MHELMSCLWHVMVTGMSCCHPLPDSVCIGTEVMGHTNQANWTITPYRQVVATLGHARVDILKASVVFYVFAYAMYFIWRCLSRL